MRTVVSSKSDSIRERYMSKVLIVDDDQVLAKMIADWLKSESFTAEVVANGKDAAALMSDFHYDVVVLDWGLPDISGLDVLKSYRQKGGTALVIMLTGHDQIDEKTHGLSSGADDYLTKPFHIKELIARIQAMLRRPRTVYQDDLKVGDITLTQATRKVFVKDREVDLLPKEFAVLEHMMRHPGHVFDADALLNRVWKSDAGVTRETVRTCITRLRKKLDIKDEESHIETIYGAGYRLRTGKD